MHRTSATNRVMQIRVRVTLYPSSLAGTDARRWYCSQITRHADVKHGNERAVIAADDDIPDSMRLCPLNDTIRSGNTLIYYAYSAIRLNHSHDFARTTFHTQWRISAFICSTLWAIKRFRSKTIYRICHCAINFPGYLMQYIFLWVFDICRQLILLNITILLRY